MVVEGAGHVLEDGNFRHCIDGKKVSMLYFVVLSVEVPWMHPRANGGAPAPLSPKVIF